MKKIFSLLITSVTFDTNHRIGFQENYVAVFSNDTAKAMLLSFDGEVVKK